MALWRQMYSQEEENDTTIEALSEGVDNDEILDEALSEEVDNDEILDEPEEETLDEALADDKTLEEPEEQTFEEDEKTLEKDKEALQEKALEEKAIDESEKAEEKALQEKVLEEKALQEKALEEKALQEKKAELAFKLEAISRILDDHPRCLRVQWVTQDRALRLWKPDFDRRTQVYSDFPIDLDLDMSDFLFKAFDWLNN